jgi:serine/threonine protein kinase
MSIFYSATRSLDRHNCEYEAKQKLKKENLFIKENVFGEGLNGKVYEVCNNANCPYVLKIIIYDKLKNINSTRQQHKKNWENEVRILEKLNDCQYKLKYKFVPIIYDSWHCDDKDKSFFFILMEKFEGNLATFIKKYQSSDAIKIASISALKTLEVYLRIIHEKCKVCLHDIKLENILYKQNGRYDYDFVFADTRKSTDNVTKKCMEEDTERFQQTIIDFNTYLNFKDPIDDFFDSLK